MRTIVSNPRNFYGLRDIDSLAGLIAVSHMVEPLIVCPEEDGKYMLLSGHRRRAAVQKLLDDGDYEERKLPCIIHERRKITILTIRRKRRRTGSGRSGWPFIGQCAERPSI